jgi:Phospholipase B
MSHSSWFTYAAMQRIYKHYDLQLRHPGIRSRRSSFSSYAGEGFGGFWWGCPACGTRRIRLPWARQTGSRRSVPTRGRGRLLRFSAFFFASPSFSNRQTRAKAGS